MSRTAPRAPRERSAAAAGFDRPLLLTAREDLVGYVSSLSGRALLFLLAASSVLAVFLIFVFITREAFLFFIQGDLLFGISLLLFERRAFKGGEICLFVDEVFDFFPDVAIGGKQLKDQEHDDGQGHHPEKGMI